MSEWAEPVHAPGTPRLYGATWPSRCTFGALKEQHRHSIRSGQNAMHLVRMDEVCQGERDAVALSMMNWQEPPDESRCRGCVSWPSWPRAPAAAMYPAPQHVPAGSGSQSRSELNTRRASWS